MKGIRALASTARNKKEAAQVKKGQKNAAKTAAKARSRDSLQALSKLGELVDGRYRIVSQPPVIIPARDLEAKYGFSAAQIEDMVHREFRAYRATLQDDRRHLLERFEFVDVARKVVGDGSVGTRAFIVLLQGRDEKDPLFVQVKEATASVLEDHLPKSRFTQPGERVVQGQRLMQATSDIYLGWTKGIEAGRYLYWRQLRDIKGSILVETLTPIGLRFYGSLCGWTLARAHARSGDAVAIAEYLATATNSTSRSPTSPSGTPNRTTSTTTPSKKQSTRGDCTRSKASEWNRLTRQSEHHLRSPRGSVVHLAVLHAEIRGQRGSGRSRSRQRQRGAESVGQRVSGAMPVTLTI
jgi:hypothetical protein